MPPNGYPSWADALDDGYQLTPREVGEFIEMIEHAYELARELHEKFVH